MSSIFNFESTVLKIMPENKTSIYKKIDCLKSNGNTC